MSNPEVVRQARVDFATQLTRSWALAQNITNEPLTSFLKTMLNHPEEQLDFISVEGKVLVRYYNRFYRFTAVRDYLASLEGVPLKDIAAQTGYKNKAVSARLDKIRDAFQVWLTGDRTGIGRALAYLKLLDAEWLDEDISAALRTQIPRLRDYAQALSMQRERFLREKIPRKGSRHR